jgi:hypothetical protein
VKSAERSPVLPWNAVRLSWKNEKLVAEVNEQTLRTAQTRERAGQPAASSR